MGNVDSVPVVSQVKSLVQVVAGDVDGAKETQGNFSRQCVVVSQIRSVTEVCWGDLQSARETQICFVKNLEGIVDATPLIGHVKGTIHYAIGDHENASKVMKMASRTTAVVASGVGGFLVGGPVGAAVAGTITGPVVDGVITHADSLAHGEHRPYGYFALYTKISDDVKNGKTKPGDIFDVVVAIPASDALAGLAGGRLTQTFLQRASVKGNIASNAFEKPANVPTNVFEKSANVANNAFEKLADVTKKVSEKSANVVNKVLGKQADVAKRVLEKPAANVFEKPANVANNMFKKPVNVAKKMVVNGVSVYIINNYEEWLEDLQSMEGEIVLDQEVLDFGGSFEGWLDRFGGPVGFMDEIDIAPRLSISWTASGRPIADTWLLRLIAQPEPPRQDIPFNRYVWRLLRISPRLQLDAETADSGDGDGTREILPRNGQFPSQAINGSDIIRHLGNNPRDSEYISTSADFSRLYNLLVKVSRHESDGRPRYLVEIDTTRLLRTSEIVDLTSDENRDLYLRHDDAFFQEHAIRFTRKWSIVLVKNFIPAEAICRVWCATDDNVTCNVVNDYGDWV